MIRSGPPLLRHLFPTDNNTQKNFVLSEAGVNAKRFAVPINIQSTDSPSLARASRRSVHEPRSASRCSGFTLLELLVVMVIIGLLAGLVAPRYFDQIGKSTTKVAKAQIDSLGKALDQYRLDVGAYPSTEEGLNALMTSPQNQPHWSGPYLQKAVPLDPWDRPYQYRSPGEHGDYDLFTLGRDGQVGGTGENADVTSW
jgi:general secretion pathway protein G